MRILAILLVAGSVLAACSSGSTSDSPTTIREGPGDTTVSTSMPATTTSAVTDDTVAPDTSGPGRPVAPDFTLELGDGGTYTLSEGAKPVYLVFWAEW